MLDQAMFDDDCEAWVHGAVYPNVYSVFRQFKYAPLPSVEESLEFGEQEQRILNAVKNTISISIAQRRWKKSVIGSRLI